MILLRLTCEDSTPNGMKRLSHQASVCMRHARVRRAALLWEALSCNALSQNGFQAKTSTMRTVEAADVSASKATSCSGGTELRLPVASRLAVAHADSAGI